MYKDGFIRVSENSEVGENEGLYKNLIASTTYNAPWKLNLPFCATKRREKQKEKTVEKSSKMNKKMTIKPASCAEEFLHCVFPVVSCTAKGIKLMRKFKNEELGEKYWLLFVLFCKTWIL